MDLITIIQQLGVEQLGRFYSIYRGVVLDRVDPDRAGKIKVSIPVIQDGLTLWARPRNFQGNVTSCTKSLTPMEGDVVYIEFEKGDPFKPLWSQHPPSDLEGMPEELSEDSMGIITHSGNKIILKEKDGVLMVELLGRFEINSSKGGSISSGEAIEVKSKDKVIINEGKNRGVVNITQIESLVRALAKDLVSVSSGQNLSTWMATQLPKLEDKNCTH